MSRYSEHGMSELPEYGPVLMRRPIEYAKMLREKIEEHGTRAWLLKTGWSRGAYGEGERMALGHTRALLNAAIGGELDGVPVHKDPNSGVEVPTSCPGVPDEILDPRGTWAKPAAYDAKAEELAGCSQTTSRDSRKTSTEPCSRP